MEKNKEHLILGAISGDIIGSVYEFDNVKTTDFSLFTADSFFTDDTVMTVATMDVLLNGSDYASAYQSYGRKYPLRGYGNSFAKWLRSGNPKPYGSFGNGSAMRVSPVGWAFGTLDKVLAEAKRSSEVTHSHPEGIKGAQAVAAAVFLARTGSSKNEIRGYIRKEFGYPLSLTVDEIRPLYKFDESCQNTVPEAIACFLESMDFENAIRLAISIGGDSDTIACITGSIAEAFYGNIPDQIAIKCAELLAPQLLETVTDFSNKLKISQE